MEGKSTRIGLYKCYQCRKPFTVKIGTVFETSHVPMRHWLQAIFLMSSSKKRIMRKAYEFCIPTRGRIGFKRLNLPAAFERDSDRVRLITCNGHGTFVGARPLNADHGLIRRLQLRSLRGDEVQTDSEYPDLVERSVALRPRRELASRFQKLGKHVLKVLHLVPIAFCNADRYGLPATRRVLLMVGRLGSATSHSDHTRRRRGSP